MEFCSESGTNWKFTNLKCPRCQYEILVETRENGERLANLCCARMGCTYTSYSENEEALLKKLKIK